MKTLTWRQKLGNPECVYAERWILKLPFKWSIRLHHFFKSDDARAHHDHPWWFITLVIRGSYVDESPCMECEGRGEWEVGNISDLADTMWESCPFCDGRGTALDVLTPGTVRYRPAEWQHTVLTSGVWTICLTGPPIRKWGFWERLADGRKKFRKANKWFFENGHHPCDQP